MKLDKNFSEELTSLEEERNNLIRTLEAKLTNNLKNERFLSDYDYDYDDFKSKSQKIKDDLLEIGKNINFFEKELKNKNVHHHDKYQIFFDQVKKLSTVSENVSFLKYINSVQILFLEKLIAFTLLQENNHKEIAQQKIEAEILKQTKEHSPPDFIEKISPDKISNLCKNNLPTKLTEKMEAIIMSIFEKNNEALNKALKKNTGIIAVSIENLKLHKKEPEFNQDQLKPLQDIACQASSSEEIRELLLALVKDDQWKNQAQYNFFKKFTKQDKENRPDGIQKIINILENKELPSREALLKSSCIITEKSNKPHYFRTKKVDDFYKKLAEAFDQDNLYGQQDFTEKTRKYLEKIRDEFNITQEKMDNIHAPTCRLAS